MAKRVFTFERKKRTKRKIHSKSKTSKSIGSQNYKKQYKGQGK